MKRYKYTTKGLQGGSLSLSGMEQQLANAATFTMEKLRLVWLVKSVQSEAMKLPVVQRKCSLVHLLVLELGRCKLCKLGRAKLPAALGIQNSRIKQYAAEFPEGTKLVQIEQIITNSCAAQSRMLPSHQLRISRLGVWRPIDSST